MGRQRHEGIETDESIFSQLFSNIYYRERPYVNMNGWLGWRTGKGWVCPRGDAGAGGGGLSLFFEAYSAWFCWGLASPL